MNLVKKINVCVEEYGNIENEGLWAKSYGLS